MNIKDAYVHVGPSGTNEKALLKDFAITAAQVTLTRAIQNDAGTGDKTETITIPTWNQSTTGNAATATKLYSTTLTGTEDLNNLINAGVYGTLSTAACASLINGPSGRNNGEMRLEVIGCADSSGYLFQKYWARNTSSGWQLYFRTKSGDSGWSSWVQNIDSGNYTNWVYAKSSVYTKTESDARFVLKAGDTMTGALTVPSLSVTGAATFSQAINGSILGNAATASRLQNARTISLTGSVTGSGTFDGSGNLSIATTTNHSHSYVNTIGKSGPTITWSINGTAQTALDFSTTFAPYNADGYLPLSGGTMTGTITRIYNAASDSPTISVQSNNQNVWIWRVKDLYTGSDTSTSQVYGFGLKYIGTQSGNDNSLGLYADNLTGTQVLAMEVKQNGDIVFRQNITAAKFIKSGGTSSQFLKADGSVDSNTYLTSATAVTNWTVKSDDANYPIAFSPNVTPSASNNAYNTGFTFNPGTKTFNNNGCRQQYDSTNKVLKFIFD